MNPTAAPPANPRPYGPTNVEGCSAVTMVITANPKSFVAPLAKRVKNFSGIFLNIL